jgi:hypothetical protein
MPIHEHDCDGCIFVGIDAPERGEPRTNQVDCYIHINPSGRITAIRRYGDEPSNNGAMDTEAPVSKYRRVLDMAKERGVISDV